MDRLCMKFLLILIAHWVTLVLVLASSKLSFQFQMPEQDEMLNLVATKFHTSDGNLLLVLNLLFHFMCM